MNDLDYRFAISVGGSLLIILWLITKTFDDVRKEISWSRKDVRTDLGEANRRIAVLEKSLQKAEAALDRQERRLGDIDREKKQRRKDS